MFDVSDNDLADVDAIYCFIRDVVTIRNVILKGHKPSLVYKDRLIDAMISALEKWFDDLESCPAAKATGSVCLKQWPANWTL